jgi:hypothetical protein
VGTNLCYGGQSGAPGGYTVKTLTVYPGDTYTICAGSGGTTANTGGTVGGSGGTSFVTGNNLVNLCATGGSYGLHCSVSSSPTGVGYIQVGGLGYGGDFPTGAGHSVVTESWQLQLCGIRFNTGAPMGGGPTFWSVDNTYGTSYAGTYSANGLNGSFPGGGGNSATSCCCLAPVLPGNGGNGQVKVYY